MLDGPLRCFFFFFLAVRPVFNLRDFLMRWCSAGQQFAVNIYSYDRIDDAHNPIYRYVYHLQKRGERKTFKEACAHTRFNWLQKISFSITLVRHRQKTLAANVYSLIQNVFFLWFNLKEMDGITSNVIIEYWSLQFFLFFFSSQKDNPECVGFMGPLFDFTWNNYAPCARIVIYGEFVSPVANLFSISQRCLDACRDIAETYSSPCPLLLLLLFAIISN